MRPVEFCSVIQRTQDISTMKQNEDQKPFVEQQNISTNIQKEAVTKHEQVTHKEKDQMGDEKYDAKEKGRGQYYNNKNGKKNSDSKQDDGSIELKSHTSFDIRI